jgi:hypothetical protein
MTISKEELLTLTSAVLDTKSLVLCAPAWQLPGLLVEYSGMIEEYAAAVREYLSDTVLTYSSGQGE